MYGNHSNNGHSRLSLDVSSRLLKKSWVVSWFFKAHYKVSEWGQTRFFFVFISPYFHLIHFLNGSAASISPIIIEIYFFKSSIFICSSFSCMFLWICRCIITVYVIVIAMMCVFSATLAFLYSVTLVIKTGRGQGKSRGTDFPD